VAERFVLPAQSVIAHGDSLLTVCDGQRDNLQS
jgi:hypothetical protein